MVRIGSVRRQQDPQRSRAHPVMQRRLQVPHFTVDGDALPADAFELNVIDSSNALPSCTDCVQTTF